MLLVLDFPEYFTDKNVNMKIIVNNKKTEILLSLSLCIHSLWGIYADQAIYKTS